MTKPERRSEVNGPRTGRSTPARASSAAHPSTKVKQEAIAAAPSASSPPGLKRKCGMESAPSSLAVKNKRLPSAAAPPIMPTRAAAEKIEVRKEKKTAPTPAVEKCIRCSVGNEKSCLACLRTTYTCAETAAGISHGQKKPEMDRMFLGVAVDGSKEEITPLSAGSIVRSSSARITGSSPNEKSWKPEEVTPSMVNNMKELLDNLQNKWDTRHKAHQEKQKELDTKIRQLQQLARECGANENTPDLWLGVLEIVHSESATNFFMGTDPVGRMTIIKHYARIHGCQDLGGSQPRDIQRKSLLKRDKKPIEDSEEEWDEVFNMFLENNPVGFSKRMPRREHS